MFPCGLKWRIHQQCHPWSSAAGTATQYTSVGIWKIRYEPNHIPTKICWSDFLPCYLLTPEVPLILHTDVTAHTVPQSKSKKINSRLSVCNFPVQTSAGVEQTAPAGFMSTGCSELIPLNLILKTVWRTTANHPEKGFSDGVTVGSSDALTTQKWQHESSLPAVIQCHSIHMPAVPAPSQPPLYFSAVSVQAN